MKLIKFDSYEEYRNAQVTANRLKFGHVFAEDTELQRVAAHFSRAAPEATTGLCHGVRNGYEVQKLRSLLPSVRIVGTDISETAASVPNCIVWDMHDVKPEWVNSIDFIYSNSWDHSFDPNRLFAGWSSCLTAKGRMYIAYTDLHSEKGATDDTKFDVFGCSLDELIGILSPHLILEDIMEIQPRVTAKMWKRRLSYLRTGSFGKLMHQPLATRRILTLALRKREPAAAG